MGRAIAIFNQRDWSWQKHHQHKPQGACLAGHKAKKVLVIVIDHRHHTNWNRN